VALDILLLSLPVLWPLTGDLLHKKQHVATEYQEDLTNDFLYLWSCPASFESVEDLKAFLSQELENEEKPPLSEAAMQSALSSVTKLTKKDLLRIFRLDSAQKAPSLSVLLFDAIHGSPNDDTTGAFFYQVTDNIIANIISRVIPNARATRDSFRASLETGVPDFCLIV
jgi:hypothetical protein